MFLSWFAEHATTYSADPLADRQARDWAVRDYRMWLLRDGPARRSRVYVNSVLTALDDFHVRRGLGKADLVLVAEILGHARLETTRRYSLPSDKDKEDALKLITVDR
ncbi:hypothetical protein [Streptosporangium sp. NBC_01756]|uniref:hypothetical protein n=1 Tax=Streptosporangium sp. NBC_01756 TaxID=2975950 RepID=UPI002DDAF055|nr:hypothetical protein [Streptosporangium sp. NBC_01756]WSC90775.1 hypothetical protein OIE48_39620 [Streptosporangium sp. NBC_01756]